MPPKRIALTATEVADLIWRFLEGKSMYPQEWNDFVESSQRNEEMEQCRKRCYELDPVVNCPGPQDSDAIAELRLMVRTLRAKSE